MSWFRVALCLLLCLPTAARAADQLFSNVAVVDPATGRIRSGQDVHVRDGRVHAIGPHRHLEVPPATPRIVGGGRYLVPGLTDLHVHLEYFETPEVLWAFLANGVTTLRQMDGRPQHLRWRTEIAAGRLPGPRLVVGSPIVNGPHGAAPDHRRVDSAAGARTAVAEFAAAGYDFVKIYHGLDAEPFEALMAAAREAHLPVAGHVPTAVGLQRAVASGLHSVEHVASLDELVEAGEHRWDWRRLGFAIDVDPRRLETAARWLARSGVWVVPTLGAFDLRYLDPAHRRTLERSESMRHAPAGMHRAWSPEHWEGERAERYARIDAGDHARLREGVSAAASVVAALHRAGARLAVGSDTPNPYLVPGFSLHDELARLHAAGLSPAQMLRMATLDAGALLDREDIGCLRPGCRADLVLLEADPLADPQALRRPIGVMAEGRWYSRERLERELAHWRARQE
jgi:imidazolonepropionase-like amidohydrolase